jgi:chromosome segregation protein
VLGRVASLVRTDPRFEPLLAHLLGDTWLVRDLAAALRLANEAPDGRFITPAGELLDADGTVSVGPPHTASGLLSRKSELRRLREDTARLDEEIERARQGIDELDRAISQSEGVCSLAEQRIADLAETLAECRSHIAARQQEVDEIAEECRVLQSEIQQLDADAAEVRVQRSTAQGHLDRVNADLDRLREAIRLAERELADADARRHECGRRATAAKVDLATSQKEVEGLRQRLDRQDERWQQHQRALSDAQSQVIEATGRLRHTTLEILRSESATARLYLEKEQLQETHQELLRRRDELRSARQQLNQQAQQRRSEVHELEEHFRRAQLESSELRHERDHLVERIREDYQVELADLAFPPPARDELPSLDDDTAPERAIDFDHTPRPQVEAEIEKLRRKIAGMGNVNLDALQELEELEARWQSLAGQRDDLVASKEDLEEIIRKINADSRKLFAETLETVRVHFHELFRKLFGGGRADIVLEDESDLLESGIDIIARPPGKEPRRLSLLSGGEKTLTAVALLLAIFRSRPSPFCVLDEVDAALDEANIDRFVEVIREFLAWTQFIVVTHSKRTMTCAGVLYGVTMQESGVSKRVAVRFEDVRDDGSFEVARGPVEEQATEQVGEQAA